MYYYFSYHYYVSVAKKEYAIKGQIMLTKPQMLLRLVLSTHTTNSF